LFKKQAQVETDNQADTPVDTQAVTQVDTQAVTQVDTQAVTQADTQAGTKISNELEFQLVDWKIQQLVSKFSGVLSRAEIQNLLELKDAEHLRLGYILPSLNSGFLEMTLRDKPSSKLQKYRLTTKGVSLQRYLTK
jgi:ATP-dependent DNA helicase RecG